jgi:uncharacterized protein (DUF1778 family)
MPTKEIRKPVTLRMSPAEIALIDAAAKAAGERPATWRRNTLLGAAKGVKSNT